MVCSVVVVVHGGGCRWRGAEHLHEPHGPVHVELCLPVTWGGEGGRWWTQMSGGEEEVVVEGGAEEGVPAALPATPSCLATARSLAPTLSASWR